MICSWCKMDYPGDDPRSHKCPDGSEFDDRMKFYREGKESPYTAGYDPTKLKLTYEDILLLQGLKIKL